MISGAYIKVAFGDVNRFALGKLKGKKKIKKEKKLKRRKGSCKKR